MLSSPSLSRWVPDAQGSVDASGGALGTTWLPGVGRGNPSLRYKTQKRVTKRATSRERRIPCEHSTGQLGKRDTMTNSEPFDFSKYRRPQFEEPLRRAAESEDDQIPAENLSELLGRVSKDSTGEIDSLIGEFQRLRGKLQTDGERIQREIEDYAALSQQVMQLTKTISESVEKVRASVDWPAREE
jgi:cell division septum initiation protein DivIVA